MVILYKALFVIAVLAIPVGMGVLLVCLALKATRRRKKWLEEHTEDLSSRET